MAHAHQPAHWSSDEEGFMRELTRSWGQRVQRARSDLGLSQRDLARVAKVTQQSISKIEQGEVLTSDRYKLRLARALGADVDELFAWPVAVGSNPGAASRC